MSMHPVAATSRQALAGSRALSSGRGWLVPEAEPSTSAIGANRPRWMPWQGTAQRLGPDSPDESGVELGPDQTRRAAADAHHLDPKQGEVLEVQGLVQAADVDRIPAH